MFKKFKKIIDNQTYGSALKALNFSIIKNISIPLPPIETQNQIVEELDGYQKIINGCNQVIENYKPSIDFDPSWKKIRRIYIN